MNQSSNRRTLINTLWPLFTLLLACQSSTSFAENEQHEPYGFHQYQQSLPASIPSTELAVPTKMVDRATPYSDPNVAVIEFDEKGGLWPCDRTKTRCQKEYAVDFVHEARKKIIKGEHLTVLTFIHGWTHNANWDDQNFLHLRQAVDCLNWGEGGYKFGYDNSQSPRSQKANDYDLPCKNIRPQKGEHYVGLYIGWQATPKSHSTSNLTLLKVFSQVNTISRNDAMQTALDEVAKATKDGTDVAAKFIVVGHSMGGLLAERIALAELKSIPQSTRDVCANSQEGQTNPIDLFVLVNPANTTSVSLKIIHSLRQRPRCTGYGLSEKVPFPYLVSVHSLSDPWTGVTGAIGLHTLNVMSRILPIKSPFPSLDSSTTPIKENDERSYGPPANWRLRGRPFHQTQFFMSACFEGSWSLKADGTGSRTGDRLCDRVSEKVKEVKVRIINDNHLPSIIRSDGVDIGTYEYLQSICNSFSDENSSSGCTGERKAMRDRAESLLLAALADLMIVPKWVGSPNPMLNLYARFDPGCRRGSIKDADALQRPICPNLNDSESLPLARQIPQAPWNNTGYWAFNVPDCYIQGHSSFWTDNFSGLILGLSRSFE